MEVNCPYCGKGFISQGALNLHLCRKQECKKKHLAKSQAIKGCKHINIRPLTTDELNSLIETPKEYKGKTLKQLGYTSICLDCGLYGMKEQ